MRVCLELAGVWAVPRLAGHAVANVRLAPAAVADAGRRLREVNAICEGVPRIFLRLVRVCFVALARSFPCRDRSPPKAIPNPAHTHTASTLTSGSQIHAQPVGTSRRPEVAYLPTNAWCGAPICLLPTRRRQMRRRIWRRLDDRMACVYFGGFHQSARLVEVLTVRPSARAVAALPSSRTRMVGRRRTRAVGNGWHGHINRLWYDAVPTSPSNQPSRTGSEARRRHLAAIASWQSLAPSLTHDISRNSRASARE